MIMMMMILWGLYWFHIWVECKYSIQAHRVLLASSSPYFKVRTINMYFKNVCQNIHKLKIKKNPYSFYTRNLFQAMFTSGMKESQWTEEEGKTVQVEHFYPYCSTLNIFVNSWYFPLFWTFCLILDFCSMLNILLQWNFLDHVQTKRFLAGYCFTSRLFCFCFLNIFLRFLIARYCFSSCLLCFC